MEKTEKKTPQEIKATFGPSLLVFLIATVIILVGILVLGLDAHIPIVFAAGVVLIYGLLLHIPYKDLEHAMIKTISESVQVLMIICIIGMLVASWMAAGTVPYIIHLGLELINPAIFLPFVAIMCALLSTMCGSSWTTASTIGIAFIGISMGMGIPVAITAGAVCCGAFFGDKQSPLSDFCIYASGVSKVDIYKHARRMLWTTAPTFIIAVIIFAVIGMGYSTENADLSTVTEITEGLASAYKLGLPALIPLVALIIMMVLKTPSVPSLALAAIIGALTAWLYQGNGFADSLYLMMHGNVIETDVETVASICNRGGMLSMASTLMLMIVSLAMAGLFDRTGLLSSIVAKVSFLVRNQVGLVASTVILSALGGYVFCDPYMAAIVPVKAFGKRYEELGLDKCVMSRSISDGALTFCPIVPWGSSGVFIAGALGIATLDYLPYYFMYLVPVVSIILAILNKGMYRYDYETDPEGQKVLED